MRLNQLLGGAGEQRDQPRIVTLDGRNDLAMQLGGQIAGSLKEVRPAHVVLDEMVREAVDVLTTLSRTRVTFALA